MAANREDLFLPTPKEKGAIGAAEAERVRHGIFERISFAGLVGDKIHSVRVGILVLEIGRGRQNLIAQGRDKLCEQVSEITGAKTLALFTDIDVQIGERVLVFTVDRDIQNESR